MPLSKKVESLTWKLGYLSYKRRRVAWQRVDMVSAYIPVQHVVNTLS